MYYSVGDEERMQIRLAVAEDPSGPFIDSGHRLTSEDFAIDPHVFVDDDGSRYLFYATDFLEHTHIGTGTVVDRMLNESMLEGRPHPVTRARYDWQVYDPMRVEKKGVRWYTVEGPFVLKRKGLFYEMFSGGNWKNISYGVSYATSERIDTQEEWSQASDGVRVLPIIRTIPGRVIGPGHNSVVRGPDNQQLFCVYHCWAEDASARVLAIDRLDWAGKRMLVLGPSFTPQPSPHAPSVREHFDKDLPSGLGPQWDCAPENAWAVQDHAAVQRRIDLEAEARCTVQAASFIAELSLRSMDSTANGGYGVAICSRGQQILRFLIVPGMGRAVIALLTKAGWANSSFDIPPEFKPTAYHLLRIEVAGLSVSIALDDVTVRWQGRLDNEASNIALLTDGMAAAFAGVSLTIGWEDQFMESGGSLAERGWQVQDSGANWQLEDHQLWCTNREDSNALITRGPTLQSYEFVINARLGSKMGSDACYGFCPALGATSQGPLISVEHSELGWVLIAQSGLITNRFDLPSTFDPHDYQQFRFCKQEGRLAIQWEAQVLGEIEAPAEATQVGLFARRALAAFDMVRVTAV
jgi:hypothetical protein